MKPGRELDTLIAEKVFLRKTKTRQGNNLIFGALVFVENQHPLLPVESVPCYSTDIRAAWEVVEKINKQLCDSQKIFAVMMCSEWCAGIGEWTPYEGFSFFEDSHGETAPHAICLAALKSMEVELK